MTYLTGSVAAVPSADKGAFARHVAQCRPLFRDCGAHRMVETWGLDVPKGEVTDFYRAVEAGADETITFSWIEWPDKATADAAWVRMQEEPLRSSLPAMPFDGSRMIYGGFRPVYEAGSSDPSGHYQGFVLAAPETNESLYVAQAREGWDLFQRLGALGMVEAWGVDVPRGKRTDFYRATKAQPGEVAVFSWIVWPDQATCDTAAREMQDMGGHDMPEMAFDMARMMWAGFEPLFESRREA